LAVPIETFSYLDSAWSCLILRLSATFIHIMEGQFILSPYPFLSFPMSVDKGTRGKESFSSQQWRCHQCLFGFIGKPSIVPNKTTYTADSFRNCFLNAQNWQIQPFKKHIQLYIISAYVLIFEITGYCQVKKILNFV
jgi:hypothetical protein